MSGARHSTRLKQNDSQSQKLESASVSSVSEFQDVFEEVWTCKGCEQSSSDDDVKMVLCEFCPDKFCISCIDMTEHQYKGLQALADCNNACWVCSECLNEIKNMKSQTKKHNHTSSEEINALKVEMNNKMASLEDKINSLTDAVKAKPEPIKKEEMQKSFAEVLVGEKETDDKNKQINVKNSGFTEVVRNIVDQRQKQHNKEMLEKEERDKNIIIYKASEVGGETAEERKARDSELVLKFLETTGCGEYQVKGMFRLGKFNQQDYDKGKHRPLKVCFHSKSDRDSVHRNLYKMKSCEIQEIKNLQIGYDLSKTEREVVRDKVQEAKDKSTDQVFWVVRGPPWALYLARSTPRQQQEA